MRSYAKITSHTPRAKGFTTSSPISKINITAANFAYMQTRLGNNVTTRCKFCYGNIFNIIVNRYFTRYCTLHNKRVSAATTANFAARPFGGYGDFIIFCLTRDATASHGAYGYIKCSTKITSNVATVHGSYVNIIHTIIAIYTPTIHSGYIDVIIIRTAVDFSALKGRNINFIITVTALNTTRIYVVARSRVEVSVHDAVYGNRIITKITINSVLMLFTVEVFNSNFIITMVTTHILLLFTSKSYVPCNGNCINTFVHPRNIAISNGSYFNSICSRTSVYGATSHGTCNFNGIIIGTTIYGAAAHVGYDYTVRTSIAVNGASGKGSTFHF